MVLALFLFVFTIVVQVNLIKWSPECVSPLYSLDCQKTILYIFMSAFLYTCLIKGQIFN